MTQRTLITTRITMEEIARRLSAISTASKDAATGADSPEYHERRTSVVPTPAPAIHAWTANPHLIQRDRTRPDLNSMGGAGLSVMAGQASQGIQEKARRIAGEWPS